jgi:hypothetical protein
VSFYVDYIIVCTIILKLVILSYHMDLDSRIAISLSFVFVCTRGTFIIPYCRHHPTNPSRCVVGEAHEHSSRYIYSCYDCNSFGCKFMLYSALNCQEEYACEDGKQASELVEEIKQLFYEEYQKAFNEK